MERNQVDNLSEIVDKLGKNLTLESPSQPQDYDSDIEFDHDDDEEEDEDGEFEFSFDGGEIKSPVSAEEVFLNGQIRSTIPFTAENGADSDRPPVDKVFVVSSSSENVVEGPYCVWSTEEVSSESSVLPEMRRKSNSTGFSRLRKMKDLLVRSNSDGKDTFVFLNAAEKKSKTKKKKKNESEIRSSPSPLPLPLPLVNVDGEAEEEKERSKTMMKKKKKGKKASMATAYEALYGKKVGDNKSYLPYRVGFFTNVNGLTKNVHPY